METDNTNLLSVVSPSVVLAASDLLLAYDYAHNAEADLWQFSVAWEELRHTGITATDLRWLLAKRYVEHRQETTGDEDQCRTFRSRAPVSFPERTCLVLTESGANAFQPLVCLLRTMPQLRQSMELDSRLSQSSESGSRQIARSGALALADPFQPNLDGRASGEIAMRPKGARSLSREASSPKRRVGGRSAPTWDAERRELRFKGKIIKQFRVPAANQEIILSAFDEEGWPERIHDPLPANGTDHRDRLQATIKSLNRHHATKLLRFHVTGAGEAICWEEV